MAYMVSIINTQTGETRTYREDLDWSDDFIWSEGNFACDCNRADFFARAGGEDDPDIDCSDYLYRVRIVLPSGEVAYDETA